MHFQTLFPFYFSSSMFEDIFDCKYKFFKKYCQKLIPVNAKNPHLIAGGNIATALERTRKAYYNNGLDADSAIEEGFTYLLTEAEDSKDDLKTTERVAFAFKRYFKSFPLEEELKPCELIDGTHAVEYQFELDLGIPHPDYPHRNLIFTGKLDFLGERKDAHNRLKRFVLDEKSTKNVKRKTGTKEVDFDREKEEYLTRGQFIGYHWAAHMLGVKTESTLIRRIPLTKEPEPPYELEVECSDFMIQCWEGSIYGEILELVERYKAYKQYEHKENNDRRCFNPVYNMACDRFASPCTYKVACLIPEGDEVLAMTCKQLIAYPENRIGQELTLSDYINQIERSLNEQHTTENS